MSILRGLFPNARVRAVPHHAAHGLYAFAASGFTDAAVLIVDSLGENCTTSIGSGQVLSGGGIRYRIRESVSDPASLGYAYGAVTMHLGWRRGDEEGTVMALAATGDPGRFRGLLARAISLTPAGFALDPRLFPLRVLRHGWPRVSPAFIGATCPPRASGEEVTQVHADLAAALQERTEQSWRPWGTGPSASRPSRSNSQNSPTLPAPGNRHDMPTTAIGSPDDIGRASAGERSAGIDEALIN